MPRLRNLLSAGFCAILVAAGTPGALGGAEPDAAPTDMAAYAKSITPFLNKYCISCHDDSHAEANFRLDNIQGSISDGADLERWEKTLEMLTIKDMPPDDADQPTRPERKSVSRWIEKELRKIGRGPDPARLVRPEFGNRVDHHDLFSGEYKGPSYSPSRIWRKTPQIHEKFEDALRFPKGASPFSPKGGHGFQDYAMLLANEATISAMRINASNYAAELLDGKLVNAKGPDGKPDKTKRIREGRSRWQEYNAMLRPERSTKSTKSKANNKQGDSQLAAAVRRTFELLLQRLPNDDELDRHVAFLQRGIEITEPRAGLEALITAVILSPEFIYRMELGLGEPQADGHRMLAPQEIAYALAFALTDNPPDAELRKAVVEGRLTTKNDVEREVRRMLAADTRRYWGYEVNHTFQRHMEACPNPRVLRFFREFFGYAGVFDVFKDKSRNPDHKPQFLFKDADLFVLSVLEEDRHVLRELLLSDRYVVHYTTPEQAERKLKSIREQIEKNRKAAEQAKQKNKKPRPDLVAEKLAKGLTPVLGGYRGGQYYTAYNLERATWNYPQKQPFSLPNRFGMLTHPAWLVAHSGNFDTDPIRRGKWIRERLLADTIPEIPIGVYAALEEDPHKTVREKLAKTTGAACWRCHKKMNPLGLPFEAYDDFGAYRTSHDYDRNGVRLATRFERQQLIQRSKQRQFAGTADYMTERPVDTTGELRGSGDRKLDGNVRNAHDLLKRLAASERVRQSFVRHAFRYWMGRNEILSDSPTLIAADQAYLESDGSFKELLVSLLTSDSFLMRK